MWKERKINLVSNSADSVVVIIKPLKQVQFKFLSSNDSLCMEVRMETRIWQAMLFCWVKLIFLPIGLAPLILEDKFQNGWKQAVYNKVPPPGTLPYLSIISGL